jgi:hypothetical protein
METRVSLWMVCNPFFALAVVGTASAGTWSPIAGASDDFVGNKKNGAQLAVAAVRFLHRGEQTAVLTNLVAITDGGDGVRIYSLDTSGNPASLDFEDEVTIDPPGIQEPIAFTPSFQSLDITGQGAEPCLVIPTLGEGSTGGSISIVQLTARSSNQLVVTDDCFSCDAQVLDDYLNLYYVAELPTGFAISIDALPEQAPPETNYIVYAAFVTQSGKFQATGAFALPDIYRGDRHVASPTRPWVTQMEHFHYGTDCNATLCFTTTHNGGVILWNPSAQNPDIYWISPSQHGWWEYAEDPDVWGELGDVHRAVILEGSSGTIEQLGNIQVDNRLLFFSDNTMGFIVADISRPFQPQHIWQWDSDLIPYEDASSWDWHGAGRNDEALDQADPGDLPGETFGIGMALNSMSQLSPATIHLYLAGGVDGLRRFDLAEFLNPFGRGDAGASNYDDFSIDNFIYVNGGEEVMTAYDLQTLSEDGVTFIFTSWRADRADEDGWLGLTVHLDAGVVSD